MNFCHVCDSLLQPKNVDGKVVSYCPDCEEIRGEGGMQKISITDEDRTKDPDAGKILILESDDGKTVGRSSKSMFCSNCEAFEQVEYWQIQTRSADESPTRFFKCLKCGKNWREYD